MDPAWLMERFGGWIAPVVVAVVHGWYALRPKRGDLEHRMIDQLQEMRSEQDTKISELDRKIDDLRDDIRWRDDYIFVLRMHIADGKPPPPPGWPSAAMRERS